MNEQQTKIKNFFLKIPMYWNVFFMCLVVFALLGNCRAVVLKQDVIGPVMMLAAIIVFWAMIRILLEGVESYLMLRLIKKNELEEKNKTKQ